MKTIENMKPMPWVCSACGDVQHTHEVFTTGDGTKLLCQTCAGDVHIRVKASTRDIINGIKKSRKMISGDAVIMRALKAWEEAGCP